MKRIDGQLVCPPREQCSPLCTSRIESLSTARSNPFTVPRPPLSSLQGPSASAYVTYIRSDDALRAIQSVNNVVVDGRTLKVTVCSRCLVHQPARVALWEIARLSCDISPSPLLVISNRAPGSPRSSARFIVRLDKQRWLRP